MHSFKIPIRSSLIIRSLISVFFLLALIFAGTGYLSIKQLENTSRDEMQRNSHYISQISAKAIALPLWNLDEQQVRSQLESLRNSESFCGARVKDWDKKIFLSVDFPEDITPSEFLVSEPIYFLNPTKDDNSQEVIGTLEVCSSKKLVVSRLNEIVFNQMLLFLAAMLAVLAACYISLLIIVHPLVNIRAAMVRVSKSMKPINDKSLLKSNEIGALANSFNIMVGDLSKTYKELSIAKDIAEKADRAKTDFLANMTHELRTPLNSIIGMTNLLKERDIGASEKEMLEIISQSSNMLLETVNDILDISKIEAGETKIENIAFDIQDLFNNVVSTVQYLAIKKGLKLKCHFDVGMPFLIGDPFRIQQILMNLLGNAIKYTDKGMIEVHLSAKKLSDEILEVYCRVIDTGIGIPENKMSNIFKKFTQVDVSNTRRFGGTGLGLAITRELVEMMGGTVGVESELNSGSTFWFKIPLKVTDRLQDERLNYVHKNRALNSGIIRPEDARLLVAEDHPLNQAFMRLLLAKYGFSHFDICDNGKAVIDAVSANNYDIILMDCFMPQINGYEATKMIRIKERISGEHLPIIAMTANVMAGEEQKCINAGMDDYIAKPVDEDNFKAVLSQWIKFDDKLKDKSSGISGYYPDAPVNLSIVKSFSNGDMQIEKKLLGLFFSKSDENLQALSKLAKNGFSNEWLEVAHSLKGGAASAGAIRLRQLCDKAQEMEGASAAECQQILDEINEAYSQVKIYLRSQGY